MCLAVPSQITSLDDNGMAQVSVMGVTRPCSVRLVPDAKVGDFVLVHAGFAIQRIEEQDARETLALLGDEMPTPDEAQDSCATCA